MDTLGISIGPGNMALIPEYAECGIQCVEISLPAKDIEELRLFAAKAYALSVESGMTLWSVHLPFGRRLDISAPEEEKRLGALDELYKSVDLARGLGAKVLVVHGSSEPNEDASRPARMEACEKSLRALQSYAGGMKVAVENLPRTCIGRTGWEMARLQESCAGICFDVNHLLMEDHAAFLDAAEKAVITTHLSDYDGVDERHWLCGMGIVPWKLVVSRLKGAGYQGPFLFELGKNQNGEPYPPKDVVKAWRELTE